MLKTLATHSAGLFNASMAARPSPLAKLAAIEEANQPQFIKDARERLRKEEDERRAAAYAAVKDKITPEFMAVLANLSRTIGHRDEDGQVVIGMFEVSMLSGIDMGDVDPIDFSKP